MKDRCSVFQVLGAKLQPPIAPSRLDQIERDYALSLPADARALYLRANGAEEDFGPWCWHFWSIDSAEIVLSQYLSRPRDYVVGADRRAIDPRKYVRFVDALIDAPLYLYCADPASVHHGEVLGCHTDNGTFDAFVAAKSVSRFLNMLEATRGDEVILVDEEAPNQAPDPTRFARGSS